MLTPKHRALFNAAYSSQLLRSPREDGDLGPATPQPGDKPGSANEKENGDRPSAA
jgi:hypothetical protein